jgi:hypothetical protein
LILPYIELGTTANAVNFSVNYNDQINKTVCSTFVSVFACPSDPNTVSNIDNSALNLRQGNYMANWGNATYTQAGYNSPYMYTTGAVLTVTFLGAPFALNNAYGVQNITDGTSNTLLMSEVIACTPSSTTAISEDHRGMVYNDDYNCSMFMAYTARIHRAQFNHRRPRSRVLPVSLESEPTLRFGSAEECCRDHDPRWRAGV